MGMSTHVVAFKPATDPAYAKMKAVWFACWEAGVQIPDAVNKYFNYSEPDAEGVQVTQKDLIKCGAITEYEADTVTGFELHVDKLPKHVTLVRFYNAF